MFSKYKIEQDLRQLSGKTTLALAALSQELKEIEKSVFTDVDQRLTAFEKSHPDSPIFSHVTLFGPLEHGRLETGVTRALAWLIDERKPHGFGCEIADLLLRLGMGGRKPKQVDCVTLSMHERSLKSSRGRIDVWAQGKWKNGKSWTLVIEVKIDAKESERQLEKYEKEIGGGNHEWIGIFLSAPATAPQTAKRHKWKVLSFDDLATELARYYLRVKSRPGADFLRLFAAGLLRDVLERPIPVSARLNSRFDFIDLVMQPNRTPGTQVAK